MNLSKSNFQVTNQYRPIHVAHAQENMMLYTKAFLQQVLNTGLKKRDLNCDLKSFTAVRAAQ